jgi:hypothetical protein
LTDEERDKQVVALSSDGRDNLDRLFDTGFFGDLQDAYRFAVAAALVKDLPPRPAPGRTTFVSVSGLDPDGLLGLAVQNLHPSAARPYALIEDLGEAGLVDVVALLSQGAPLTQYIASLVYELDQRS